MYECSNDSIFINAPVHTVFNHFSDVNNWATWSNGIAFARLPFASSIKDSNWLIFAPRLGRLPPAPLLIRLYQVEQNKLIQWGLKTPVGKQIHEFRFEEKDGGCLVHNIEYAEGLFKHAVSPIEPQLKALNYNWLQDLAACF